jgi:hypothetical protein
MYEGDLSNLVRQWEDRASFEPSSSYAIATKECAEEVKNLINQWHLEQSAQDDILAQLSKEELEATIEEWKADDVLASGYLQEQDLI